MPADREGQARRREAILEILREDPKIEEQKDLVERLREKGIQATQSSVSRDLRDLGAVRSKGYYMIPSWEEEEEEQESPFRKVVDFILEVKPAGPYQTLLITAPGAAGVVAQAIDAAQWEDIVGTLAGDNSVLILTDHVFDQKLLFERLKYFMEAEGE
jgi:transcriptional regulator of arginine metabolism